MLGAEEYTGSVREEAAKEEEEMIAGNSLKIIDLTSHKIRIRNNLFRRMLRGRRRERHIGR